MMMFPEKTLTQTQVCAFFFFLCVKRGKTVLKTSCLVLEVWQRCFHLKLEFALCLTMEQGLIFSIILPLKRDVLE